MEYEPGSRNIGRAEQRKRYIFGYVGFFFAVFILWFALPIRSPLIAVALFLSLLTGFEGVYQGYLQFCAGFAAKGIYDVSEDGTNRQNVESWAAREQDVRKARRTHLYALLSAGVLTATILGVHL